MLPNKTGGAALAWVSSQGKIMVKKAYIEPRLRVLGRLLGDISSSPRHLLKGNLNGGAVCHLCGEEIMVPAPPHLAVVCTQCLTHGGDHLPLKPFLKCSGH